MNPTREVGQLPLGTLSWLLREEPQRRLEECAPSTNWPSRAVAASAGVLGWAMQQSEGFLPILIQYAERSILNHNFIHCRSHARRYYLLDSDLRVRG